MADSPEEKAHWQSVIRALGQYETHHLTTNHARRMAFLTLPKDSRDAYEELGYLEKIEAVDEAIRRYCTFTNELI